MARKNRKDHLARIRGRGVAFLPYWVRRRKLISFTFRVARAGILSVFLLLLVLTSFILYVVRTPPFRAWALPHIHKVINNELKGRVEIGDFDLDIMNGLSLTNVRLIAAGDTLASVPSISVQYLLYQFLRKGIHTSSVRLDSPTIKLLRSTDSTWNFEHIAKPTSDTSASSPFDWTIIAEMLELCDANVLIRDSLAAPVTPLFPERESVHPVDFSDLYLTNLNAFLSAHVNIAHHVYKARVNSLRFLDERSGLDVTNLDLVAELNDRSLDLQRLDIRTAASSVGLSLRIDGLSVFDGIDDAELSQWNIEVRAFADALLIDDVRRFLPHLLMEGFYRFDVAAKGTLDNLLVQRIEVTTPFSELDASGTLWSIRRPSDLRFEAAVRYGDISFDEFQDHTSVLQIPPLPFLGQVSLRNSYVFCRPTDSIFMNVEATCASGNVDGECTIYLRNTDTLAYNLDAEFSNANLGPITGLPTFTSSLNGSVRLSGRGLSLNQLDADLSAVLRDSDFNGRHIETASIVANSRSGGLITVDTLGLAVNARGRQALFDVDDYLQRGVFTCSGYIDLRYPDYPDYNVSCSAQHLPLRGLVGVSGLPEFLDATVNVRGAGFHLDSLSARLDLDVREMQLFSKAFRPFTIKAEVERQGGERRSVRVESRLVNAKVSGTFRIADLFTDIALRSAGIVDYVGWRSNNAIPGLGTNPIPRPDTGARVSHWRPTHPVDAQFYAEILDFEPLDILLDTIRIRTKGILSGSWNTDSTHNRVSIDSLNLENFSVTLPSVRVSMGPVGVSGLAESDMVDGRYIPTRILSKAKVETEINVNGLQIVRPSIDLAYRDGRADFGVSGGIEDYFGIVAGGQAFFEESRWRLEFDSLATRFTNMSWQVQGGSKVDVAKDGFNFDIPRIVRDSGERVSVFGQASFEKANNLRITIADYKLKDLSTLEFLPSNVSELLKTLRGTADTVSIFVDGPFSSPALALRSTFSDLSYSGVTIGSQVISFDYRLKRLNGSVVVSNSSLPSATKTLEAFVDFPIDLTFADVSERVPQNERLAISIKANDVSLGVIAPFVPGIASLKGFAEASLKIEGTPSNVNYAGKGRFYGASFRVLATNIYYAASGVLSIKNDKVSVDSVVVRNERNDYRNGSAFIKGMVKLKNFDIDQIDLTIKSRGILVLSRASAETMPTMYGRFIISTGEKPLKLYGSLKAPFLRGDVDVLEADITLPPEKKTKSKASNFTYQFKRESNGAVKLSIDQAKDTLASLLEVASSRLRDSVSPNREAPAPVESADHSGQNGKKQRKRPDNLAELMDYDCNVRILGPFVLTLVIQESDLAVVSESMRAEVEPENRNIPLRFEQKPFGFPRLYGSLRVKDNSEYRFLKTFKASGRLEFATGDIINPSLDLRAVYSGQRRMGEVMENYRVVITMRGTKLVPQVDITYFINDLQAVGDSSQVRGDALMMMIVGRTQAELARTDGATIGAELSNSLSTAATQLFSGVLKGTGLINDASINFRNGVADLNTAILTLGGQLFGDVTWRFGGTVGDFTSNQEFSIDVPLSAVTNLEFLNDVLLQLTRSTNTTGAVTRQQKEWEAKIGVRFAF